MINLVRHPNGNQFFVLPVQRTITKLPSGQLVVTPGAAITTSRRTTDGGFVGLLAFFAVGYLAARIWIHYSDTNS